MDPLIAILMVWIAENSDYQTADIPAPTVIELSAHELTREYYAGVPHLMPDDGVDERLNALYAANDGPHGTIYLISAAQTADAAHFDDPYENPIYREVLLHELVHHVQWQTGESLTWQCDSQGELEAYILGGAYLRQKRADDPMPNRMFWAHTYARC